MVIESIPTFLVRYGDYVWRTEYLDTEGRAQAEGARDRLVALGVGRLTLIFALEFSPAQETAKIIQNGLGGDLVTDDDAMADLAFVSRDPQLLDDTTLDKFLEETLTTAGYDLVEYDDLVVVTRARLIGAAQGMGPRESDRQIPHGFVYEYPEGSWPVQAANHAST